MGEGIAWVEIDDCPQHAQGLIRIAHAKYGHAKHGMAFRILPIQGHGPLHGLFK